MLVDLRPAEGRGTDRAAVLEAASSDF